MFTDQLERPTVIDESQRNQGIHKGQVTKDEGQRKSDALALDFESDVGGGPGQALVKTNECPPLRASLAPYEGRSQLKRVGGMDNLTGKQFFSPLTNGFDGQDLQPGPRKI